MDAKPQRPSRPFRAYGDENALPAGAPQKSIHQRNKSSPALSSMVQNGASKGISKRTVFGDVSNTSNIARPSKDDSELTSKHYHKPTEKHNSTQGDKNAITMQRPAQRPLSVSGLKSILGNVANSAKIPITKQPLAEIQKSMQSTLPTEMSQKAIGRKGTMVFKDPLFPSKEQQAPAPQGPQNSALSIPPVHRDLAPRQEMHATSGAIEPHLPQVQTHIADMQRLASTEPTVNEEVKSDDNLVVRSDGVYIDDNGAIQVYEFEDAAENFGETVELAGTRVSSRDNTQEESLNPPAPERVADNAATQPKIDPIHMHTLPPVPEPEEYWEEDTVEPYEEEGYVTARSFKSRADNTTGNATTVLLPKVTQKVKLELAAAKDFVEASKTIEELEDEAWDTTMVAEYGEEIFQYMKELEIKMLPNAHYMDNQAEIQWSMRAVLMDWIVQVHHRFNLLPETLFLCVNYIDRFLSCKVVSLGKLQLVGATAIFIAAKYEEIDCPSVQEIVYMVDSGYSVDEILKAERFMLSMLQFELGWPGPMSFLRRISKADDYDLETRTLAKYFLEITIMDERFVGSPPSYLAAGAHCLARMMLRKGIWSPAHVYYSNYTYSQLFPLVLLMVECCEDARKHHCAVFDKYTDKRYKRASQFAETEMRKGFQILDMSSNHSPHFGNNYDFQSIWDSKNRPLGEAY